MSISASSSRSRSCAARPRRSTARTASPARSASPPRIRPTSSSGGHDFGGLVRAAPTTAADDEFAETGVVAARSGDWSGLVAYTRRDGHELDNRGSDAGHADPPAPRPIRRTAFQRRAGPARLRRPATAHRFRLTAEYADGFTCHRRASPGAPRPPLSVDLPTAATRIERDRVAASTSAMTGDGAIDFAQVALYWQDSENRQFTAEDRNPAADRTRLNTFDNRVYRRLARRRARASRPAPSGTALIFGGDISRHPPGGPARRHRAAGRRDLPDPRLPGHRFHPGRRCSSATRSASAAAAHALSGAALRSLQPGPEDDPLLPAFAGADQSGSRVSPKIGAVVAARRRLQPLRKLRPGLQGAGAVPGEPVLRQSRPELHLASPIRI